MKFSLSCIIAALVAVSTDAAEFKVDFEGSWSQEEGGPLARRLSSNEDARRLLQDTKTELRGGGKPRRKLGGKKMDEFLVTTDDDYSVFQVYEGDILSFDGTTDEAAICSLETDMCHGAVSTIVQGEEDDNGCPSITLGMAPVFTGVGNNDYYRIQCPTLLSESTIEYLGCIPLGESDGTPASCGAGEADVFTLYTSGGSTVDFHISSPADGVTNYPFTVFVSITCCQIETPDFLN